MARAILLAWESLGVEIVSVEESGSEVLATITVPETCNHVDVHGNEMAGLLLIKRLESKTKNLFPDLKIIGSVRRGEHWRVNDSGGN